MENFAIDLDKVLDDFELDEDENDNSFHYEKLQLEFQRENPGSDGSHNISNYGHLAAGLGAIGGWSEAVHDASVNDLLPVGARGPPDGHDAEISEVTDGHDSQISDDPSKKYYQENAHSSSYGKHDHLNYETSTYKLEQPSNIPLEPSNINYDLIDNQSLPDSYIPQVFCSLDVIPSPAKVSHSSINSLHDSNHPDILDVMQSSEENRQDYFPQEEENSGLIRELCNDGNHLAPQREPVLLPDIMASNNDSANNDSMGISQNLPRLISDVSDPAIVTENSPNNLHYDEPAIVQESLLINRIPEIANIHQSAEYNCSGSHDKLRISNRIDAAMTQSDHESRMENVFGYELGLPDDHEHDHIYFSTARSLPDVSVNNNEATSHVLEESINNSAIHEPNMDIILNVNEEELDAELLELEEEQARLQGAYVNSRFSNEQAIDCHLDKEESIEFSNNGNQSQSPDVIGGMDLSLDKPSQSIREELHESDIYHNDPDIAERKDCQSVALPLYQNNDNLDQAHAIDSHIPVSDQSYYPSNPELVSGVEKIFETEDDLSSESTGTDTVSSSSTTLTEGESFSADNQASKAELPDPSENSSLREIPGNLVTAVFDDNHRPGLNDQSLPLVGAEGIDSSSHIDAENMSSSIGMVAPFWIPDDEAPNCQECGVKFTVIRRRHHCRGCGRVLCASCCHFKTPLPYMEYKEARVCNTCLQLISEGKEEETAAMAAGRPNPNNPMEYCSRIPPQQQVGVGGISTLPSVMVPIGVLKRENSGTGASSKGSKQVIFSDGIRPGGDLTELGGQARPSSPFRKAGRVTKRIPPNLPGSIKNDDSSGAKDIGTKKAVSTNISAHSSGPIIIPVEGGLPPLISIPSSREYACEYNPDASDLDEILRGDGPPAVFALQKNLHVLVKLIKLDCCVGIEVWNVATRGLCNVGQEELIVLLEVIPGEKGPPAHLFAFFQTVYQQANKGNLVTDLGHTIFTEPEGFLGSKDHGGFLYIRPSFQCLQKLILPPSPYIFAILIQKWETPWAKVFPLRLMLRLGAEFRYYPCPLVSSRNRKPVYCEIGHTIMNLLVDFRNYAYTVPAVQGFVIHMEDKKTSLLIPRNRYEQVWKALNNSNDHVLALGANFSPLSDSHLVTVEDDDGHYSTQAINIHNKPRKVTGASFIVFNGALKSNSGLKAKSSIVEDGLMVQIPGEMMCKLRDALHNMKNFDIPCGPSTATEPDELVCIQWIDDDKNYNVGIRSPIDDRQMDGIPSVKIHSGTDYISNDHLIRWTEVFIIQGETTTSNSDINISRLAESLARACCVALTPHLEQLYEHGPNRLGLRATMHAENVGYESGIRGSRLLPSCMKELDTELIPVIHRAAANITDEPIVLELIFHIMEQ